MGQKVNPISLRLQKTNRFFDSCWYSDYFYTDLLTRDLQIQYYLNTVLKQLKKQVNYTSARFFIKNSPKLTEISLFFYSPRPYRKIRAKAFRLRKYKRRKPRRKKSFYVISNKLFLNVVQKAYTPLGYNRDKRRKFAIRKRKRFGLLYKHNPSHFFRFRKRKRFRFTKHFFRRRKLIVKHLIKRRKKLLKLLIRRRSRRGKKRHILRLIRFGRVLNRMYSQKTSYLFLRKQFYFRYLLVLEYFIKQCGSLGCTKNYFILLLKNLKEAFNQIKIKIFTGKVTAKAKKRVKKEYPYFKKIAKKLEEERQKSTTLGRRPRTSRYICIEKKKTRVTSLVKSGDDKPQQQAKGFTFTKITRSTHWEKAGFSWFSNLVVRFKLYQKGVDYTHSLRSPGKRGHYYEVTPFHWRQHVESVLSKQLKTQVIFKRKGVKRERKDFKSALFLAEEIVHFLERRVPFRRIIHRIFKELQKIERMKDKFGNIKNIPKKVKEKVLKYMNYPHIEGVRVVYSGRIGGRSKKAQRAKTECYKYGPTSLNVFSYCIDFASKKALTRFGLAGVKVWAYNPAVPRATHAKP